MAATWSALSCSQAARASGLLVSHEAPLPVPHMPVPPQEPEPPHMPPPHQESPQVLPVGLGEGVGVGVPIIVGQGEGLPIMPLPLAPAIGTSTATARSATARVVRRALRLGFMCCSIPCLVCQSGEASLNQD